MKSIFFRCFFGLSMLLFAVACKQEKQEKSLLLNTKAISEVRYAKGFDIERFENHIKLIIKSPYPNSKQHFTYLLKQKKKDTVPSSNFSEIHIPITRLASTSTTHIPMIELLDAVETLVGFQNTQYVSSKKVNERILAGKIVNIGKEAALHTETLLDLDPEILIGFAMTQSNKAYTTIERAGIPVLLNGDWLEKTPLGRAEWIKFFGVLFDKSEQANTVFNDIERNYLAAKKTAAQAKNRPTVLAGAIMNSAIWNLPAGESFVAQFLEDANTQYLWGHTAGKGSLSLSFESVFENGQEADLWVIPGYFTSSKQLLNSNQQYQHFTAFKNKRIFTPNNKKGFGGGVLYYELAPTRPDLVLKDLIKIAHPSLLPNYKMTFFERME